MALITLIQSGELLFYGVVLSGFIEQACKSLSTFEFSLWQTKNKFLQHK